MVKLALAQFSGNRDKELNVQAAERMTREAAAHGARIVCFPELCTTIYFCYENNPEHFKWAEPVPGPSVDRMRRVAKETGTVIVYPLYENDHGELYNCAAVVGPDGDLLGKYRKSSIPQILRTVAGGETPADERFYFREGNLGFPVFKTPFGVTLGILICYDRHFPEAARVLGLQGAHLLLVPTATYRPWIRDVWELELRAHAISNIFYVGGVNKVGEDTGGYPGRHYFGTPIVIDPKGNVAGRGSDTREDILITDIDPALVEDTRELWGFYKFRRPDAYGKVVEPRHEPAVR
ncbi:MAG TPA: nitrilase-related carbon-nitrogen hydrolase [bacterium]|nr:nitrilase-related carbon-nitrogen hydrolase [bacterium]